MSETESPTMHSKQPSLLQVAAQSAPGQAAAPRPPVPASRPAYTDEDTELLARLIFAEGASEFKKPGAYLGIGNTVLNRVGVPGFANTLRGVITQPGQFQSVGGRLWNDAANPAGLTGLDATAYAAARSLAEDLIGGSEYLFDDPTGGATYFYSGPTPVGFFTRQTRSGRLQPTYKGGKFTFLRDTQR